MGKTFRYNYWEYGGLDLELFFCCEILKLHSLHYGYWSSGEELTLDNFRKAQKRYIDTLISMFPKKIVSVLDVGCGIGDTARVLADKGHIVTAISPDINHKKFFDKNVKNPCFFLTTFEEFKSDKKFDLILMSESQNYFDTDEGFQQCRRYLKPRGYLLVSGMFKKEAGQQFKDIINIESKYLNKAGQYNLELIKRIDITKQVVPTLVLAHQILQDYVPPIGFMIKYYLKSSNPAKKIFLKLIFRKQIKDVKKALKYYQERTDYSLFEANVKYLRLLFQNIRDK